MSQMLLASVEAVDVETPEARTPGNNIPGEPSANRWVMSGCRRRDLMMLVSSYPIIHLWYYYNSREIKQDKDFVGIEYDRYICAGGMVVRLLTRDR